MQLVCDQLTDARDHLALDEAMLLAADAGEWDESLRIWEMPEVVVVAGRSTRVGEEIDTAHCRMQGIPVLRRCSGGASVVAGPGCLMYSVVLRLDGASLAGQGELRKIDVAHRQVMGRVLRALRCQLAGAEFEGTCDLTWKNRKCSGNSLRVTRGHLLYHGTLLYDFELPLIQRCLRVAPRQPDYRRGRDHGDFVTNVPVDINRFASDLGAVFGVERQVDAASLSDRIAELRRARYDDPRWHLRH